MSFLGGIDFSFLENKQNINVLDYGCGNGMYSVFLIKKGYKVTSVDINSDSKHLIQKQLNEEENKRFNFYCLDAEKDFFPNISVKFDCILCRETLEHVKNYEKLTKEFSCLLKHDGLLIVSVPTYFTEKYFLFCDSDWLKKCCHVNIFKKKEIIALAKKYNLNISKITKHSFRRTIFWSLVAPFKINHDMGKILEHKKLARTANFLSDSICYFKFVEKVGNYLLPKSRVFYFKKNNNEL